MVDMGYAPDAGPAVMYFLTAHFSDKDVADIQKLIPRKDLVEAWRDIEDHAKELAKRLMGKEAATPSRTWQLLSSARPEMVLFLAVTARQQAVEQKIKNYLPKWRQVQQKIPLPEMTELLITPQLPEYPKLAHEVFLLLLDGKLRSRTETLKFLKPYAPPPPPPHPAADAPPRPRLKRLLQWRQHRRSRARKGRRGRLLSPSRLPLRLRLRQSRNRKFRRNPSPPNLRRNRARNQRRSQHTNPRRRNPKARRNSATRPPHSSQRAA
jgi:hypothetical protein